MWDGGDNGARRAGWRRLPKCASRGVVAGAALDLVVDESVAEVLGYVLDVVSLQAEGLGGLECDKSAGGGGRRSMKGRRRHQDRSSSPLKLPGPNMQQLCTPSRNTWLLWRCPLTTNSILCTGSPSLVIYAHNSTNIIKNKLCFSFINTMDDYWEFFKWKTKNTLSNPPWF